MQQALPQVPQSWKWQFLARGQEERVGEGRRRRREKRRERERNENMVGERNVVLNQNERNLLVLNLMRDVN